MGCDIHLYVEKKVDGVWQFQGTVVEEDEEDDDEGHVWANVTAPYFYDGRNYNLFAILADVRNGRGFAGVKTGEGFVPISEPLGVPEDASPEYSKIVKSWDCDGHSHSYHTLRDVLDYDWTQTTTLQGWCSMPEWANWISYARGQGRGPDNYCGSVSGAGIEHITAEAADALFEGKDWQERQAIAEANARVFAPAVWQVPYYRAAGSFLNETIPMLLRLAGGTQHLDDVRIVFFFDN